MNFVRLLSPLLLWAPHLPLVQQRPRKAKKSQDPLANLGWIMMDRQARLPGSHLGCCRPKVGGHSACTPPVHQSSKLGHLAFSDISWDHLRIESGSRLVCSPKQDTLLSEARQIACGPTSQRASAPSAKRTKPIQGQFFAPQAYGKTRRGLRYRHLPHAVWASMPSRSNIRASR